MPRNQSFEKLNKPKNSKEIYRDINNGVIKENLSKSLKRTKKNGFLNTFSKLLFKLFLILLILTISLIAGATFAVWSFSQKLPDISKIESYAPSETSEIYDVNGRLLAKLHDEENRTLVPLKEIPVNVQHAVIAMEDERFYHHIGVDPKGMLRAAGSFFDKKLIKGGASTITQQLARNLFLTPEVKITRKIAEWMLAIKIENRFPKSKILELYLNQVYWGHNAYGVEAASRNFFGKSVRDLDLAEASLMGGLLSSPEYYSPHRDFKLAKWRQSLTLQNMVRLGFINRKDADKAKKEEIKLYNVKKSYKILNPYFTSYVISLLTEKYGDSFLRKGGLKIYTTMDPKAQAYAEKLISTEVPKLRKSNNVGQGALISLDPSTGFIKTIVGGTSYESSQFNRATQAKRQPGSSFKPFLYATAFKEGIMTPDSVEVDSPISFPDMGGTWTVHNYEPEYRGTVTIRDAMKHSINTIAVKTIDKVGVDKVIETCKIFGIESYIPPNLSIALGTAELTPIELASAYGVFATGGKKVRQVTPILKIKNRNGEIIEDNSNQELEQVFPHRAIDMLNDCTEAVIKSGTGTAAKLPGRIVAGKTGTTSDHKDAWFAGYTPQLVTVVWMGNDNSSKMFHGSTGGLVCAPLWKRYMEVALKGIRSKDFPKAGANDTKIVRNRNLRHITGTYLNNTIRENKVKVNTELVGKKVDETPKKEVVSNIKIKPSIVPVASLMDTKQENNPYVKDKSSKIDSNDLKVKETKSSIKAVIPEQKTVKLIKNETVRNIVKTKIIPIEKPKPVPTPIQIIIRKKEPKKVNKKIDQDLNNAMEDLKSVKELYNSR
ncbi:MAG: PBP1A family penicillin-binding protein [Candidatus Sericytochromatia bacterium]|nr:PBP1A family penicillin-binding protein [Candidatus Sericytochromatia bacterium]